MEFFLHISCEWNDQGPGTAHCTFASWRSVIRSGARPFSGSRGEDRHTSTGFPGFQDFLFRKFVASSLIPTDIRWIQLHLIFLTISATAGIQGDGETNARRRVEATVILEAYFWIKGIVWDQLISQCMRVHGPNISTDISAAFFISGYYWYDTASVSILLLLLVYYCYDWLTTDTITYSCFYWFATPMFPIRTQTKSTIHVGGHPHTPLL